MKNKNEEAIIIIRVLQTEIYNFYFFFMINKISYYFIWAGYFCIAICGYYKYYLKTWKIDRNVYRYFYSEVQKYISNPIFIIVNQSINQSIIICRICYIDGFFIIFRLHVAAYKSSGWMDQYFVCIFWERTAETRTGWDPTVNRVLQIRISKEFTVSTSSSSSS